VIYCIKTGRIFGVVKLRAAQATSKLPARTTRKTEKFKPQKLEGNLD
jgi:hypothetical protein